ncbi:sulfotransferase [Bacteroidota bacterium]
MKRIAAPLLTLVGKSIERRRFSDPPIYIGGCGRSGTTLLLSILSAHPDIFACPRELWLFQGASIKNKKVRVPKFYRLYRTFIRSRIPATAKRYCEKTPSNILDFELIDHLHHGNFRFIQIIRDGRDVILSKHPRDDSKYWISPERWIRDINMGLKYLDHPKVHTIKYESLVTEFDKTIEGICDFLGIPLLGEIKNWHKYASVRENRALFSPIQEISNSSVGKWKLEENKERMKELTDLPEGIKLLKELNYL